MYQLQNSAALTHWQWWQLKQADYNKGLIASGVIAFVIWCLLGSIIITPRESFEVSVPTMIVQALVYLMVMFVANVCYLIGFVINLLFNRTNDHHLLSRLFAWVFWFSCALPNAFVLGVLFYHLIKK